MTKTCELWGRDIHREGGIPGRCTRCEELEIDAMAEIRAEPEGVA